MNRLLRNRIRIYNTFEIRDRYLVDLVESGREFHCCETMKRQRIRNKLFVVSYVPHCALTLGKVCCTISADYIQNQLLVTHVHLISLYYYSTMCQAWPCLCQT